MLQGCSHNTKQLRWESNMNYLHILENTSNIFKKMSSFFIFDICLHSLLKPFSAVYHK